MCTGLADLVATDDGKSGMGLLQSPQHARIAAGQHSAQKLGSDPHSFRLDAVERLHGQLYPSKPCIPCAMLYWYKYDVFQLLSPNQYEIPGQNSQL